MLAVATLVVVAIEGQAIAVCTEGLALLVIAPSQAGERIGIGFVPA